MVETLCVPCETSIFVQSSAYLKRFTFSFRTKFIVYIDQLYFAELVHVSRLQFLVSSIRGAAVEEEVGRTDYYRS